MILLQTVHSRWETLERGLNSCCHQGTLRRLNTLILRDEQFIGTIIGICQTIGIGRYLHSQGRLTISALLCSVTAFLYCIVFSSSSVWRTDRLCKVQWTYPFYLFNKNCIFRLPSYIYVVGKFFIFLNFIYIYFYKKCYMQTERM